MTPTKRTLVAVVLITVGWTLIVVGYDKPEWFFQASGIAGSILVAGAAIWWPVSARRARSQRRENAKCGAGGS
jgi:predicted tellurium resistance membrane protein TerC